MANRKIAILPCTGVGWAGGLAIGAVVTFDCLAAGTCCGASMNPARSLGPAVFAGGIALKVLWLYWCAPMAGAIGAGLTYEWVRGPTPAVASDGVE